LRFEHNSSSSYKHFTIQTHKYGAHVYTKREESIYIVFIKFWIVSQYDKFTASNMEACKFNVSESLYVESVKY